MKTAIVCYYADVGRPYLPLLEQMTVSVKQVIPNAETVLLTPTPDCGAGKFFDHVQAITDRPTTDLNLCQERAIAMTSFMLHKHNCNTVFVDPDLVFLQEPQFGKFDVGLMWREKKPDQPINTGMILAKPGAEDFWKHYGEVIINLPPAVHHWWCDQLGFALLTGVCHKAGETILVDDARVKLLDLPTYCPISDEGTVNLAWAIHLKGRRKGPGWEEIYRNDA